MTRRPPVVVRRKRSAPLAQDELAGLLGGSRQRVNVELKWLERQGLISVRPRGIELHDVQGLQALVDQAAAAAEGKPGG